MDKMSENPNLISLINSNKPETGSRSRANGETGDAFSKILEKKTGKSEETAEKTRETVADDKQADKAREKSQQQTELEERLKAKLTAKTGDLSMANYLYNIVLQNPDSLSLSEKQAFKVGEFSSEAMSAKDFQKMLGERGLDIKDFSMHQLAQLTRMTNKSQVTAFVDELAKKVRDEKGLPQGETMRTTDEARPQSEKDRKSAEATRDLRQTERPQGEARFDRVAESQRPQSTETSSRKEEREKVIQQIIERMEIQSVGRKTEITLKMNPEYLGEMRIKLSSEGGKLEAAFETTSREVRQYIEEGWEGLRDTFTRKGLNLQKVTATLVESVA